jgi:hypothetical protein
VSGVGPFCQFSGDADNGTWSLFYSFSRNVVAGEVVTASLDYLDASAAWNTLRTYTFPVGALAGTVAGVGGGAPVFEGLRLRMTVQGLVNKLGVNSILWNPATCTMDDPDIPSRDGQVIDFGSQIDDILPLMRNIRLIGRSALITYIGGANVAGTAIGVWTKGNRAMEHMDYESLSVKNEVHLFTRETGAYTYSRVSPNDEIWRDNPSEDLSDNNCRIIARATIPDGYAGSVRLALCFRVEFTTNSVIFQDYQGQIEIGDQQRKEALAWLSRQPNWSENDSHVENILDTVNAFSTFQHDRHPSEASRLISGVTTLASDFFSLF